MHINPYLHRSLFCYRTPHAFTLCSKVWFTWTQKSYSRQEVWTWHVKFYLKQHGTPAAIVSLDDCCLRAQDTAPNFNTKEWHWETISAKISLAERRFCWTSISYKHRILWMPISQSVPRGKLEPNTHIILTWLLPAVLAWEWEPFFLLFFLSFLLQYTNTRTETKKWTIQHRFHVPVPNIIDEQAKGTAKPKRSGN